MNRILLDRESLQGSVFRTNTSKLILFCLLRDAGEDGIVNTSALSIAKELGVCEKTVRNNLISFSERGIIDEQYPILSPKKVRYKGRTIKLTILDNYKESKKCRIRKKSDIQSDIITNKNSKKFAPPTEQEIYDYVADKGFHFDPESFIPFYQSKGWKVGNQPMKDWEAACRTWELKWKEKYGEQFYYQINKRSASGQADHYARIMDAATTILQQPGNLDTCFDD